MREKGHFFGRKLFACLLVLTMVLSMFGTGFADTAETTTKKIVILHTNDIHGRIESDNSTVMGLAKFSAWVKQQKEENPNTLVLDAGDIFHGLPIVTINKGESMAKIMDLIGYDAMTAGNHDFNYGYERLLELDQMTKFPVLGANVKKADGTTLLTPYVIKEVNGVKIGIFGLATPETTYKTHPKNVEGLVFADPVAEAKAMVAELEEKTDMIIFLSHLGMDEASVNTSTKVAQEVKGIDLIIDGHSHHVLQEGKMIGDTLIASAGEYSKYFGKVEVSLSGGKVTGKKASLVDFKALEELAADQEVESLITAIKTAQDKALSEVIGKAAVKLEGAREKVRTGETNLGNLITSAMLNISGADVALTNGGGIRASIEAGDISLKSVVTVLPFGNIVVTRTVKGADIKAALEHGLKPYPEANGGFPHVAGMSFTIDASKPAGERVTNLMVKGQPIELEKEYLLATNDFMAAGGDGYTMLANKPVGNDFAALDEALISYIRGLGTVAGAVEGRITVINEIPKTEKVQVPVPAPAPAPLPAPAPVVPQEERPAQQTQSYEVKAGDVLWRIAKQFGTTWEKLQEMNSLKNPHLIFPGQKLIVPAQ
ncbi:2',3'-cyclic-nucleotide 2'-phosphodiesterase/5'-or 3'-nucleotidase, 5'-nucleotidase family [Geosporobacter subterraneus DSM 17957]|uniref:2',3'-cyclic-nucleotide 2'-phosphodiesterase/5'-or 3'-nucleotidase, 5'-nucleotidase family n=1 Tax=Geosporobacter subterraneus DSM 17957 TaxID=1121919 RepID=A0A1M6NBD1_9FIRM|nr:5'-nucleotidase C-terminal domain-containing protein [Geosporobacter subterraneus]SHJ92993.1 2',3'-cyclic-nucleotide 2'-phosphodiesterase/5'-or 3'-nucleotidase, 5'-nucleotidase family [Geosporobacter subterraneus DSM 17957]